MPSISTIERVKLNYATCTIVSIVIYTFSISTFSAHFSTLWPHTLFFIVAELTKLTIIQKLYALDVTYCEDGIKKRRSNKVGESIKFALLMVLTCLSFAFICVIMGGKWSVFYESTRCLSSHLSCLVLSCLTLQLHRWKSTSKHSHSQLF